MGFAGGSERLSAGTGGKQQVLEAGLGDFLQAPPLLNRDKNRCLNPSLGNDLRPFREACGKELAETRLGLLNLPHFAHVWSLLDESDQIYDYFSGIATATVLKFRHLLERHGLGEKLMAAINASLAARGLTLREGTVVDASIVAAPTSTKNRSGERDPEMHQTKKGNQWHFGMKMHVGSDAETGVAHSLAATAANESDVAHAHRLLHGGEKRAWGDSGYQGVEKCAENRGRGGVIAAPVRVGAAKVPEPARKRAEFARQRGGRSEKWRRRPTCAPDRR